MNWTGEAFAANDTRTIDMRNIISEERSASVPHIRFAAISKIFYGPHGEEFRALDAVNLSIGKSEFFTLLGPSGCGKTTLLRMLAGFIDPTEGEIILDGKNQIGIASNAWPAHDVRQLEQDRTEDTEPTDIKRNQCCIGYCADADNRRDEFTP